MVGSPINAAPTATVKFLCSYGGQIRPRHPDRKLRYYGGETRVLAVHRRISFAELLVKLGEMFGASVSLRCQLPTEDLDALVSITSEEDLANLIEEYDRAASLSSSSLKVRAFLFPPKSIKKISPSLSTAPPYAAATSSSSSRFPAPAANCCVHQISPTPSFAFTHGFGKPAGKVPHYAYHAHGNSNQIYYLLNNGNHWQ